MPYRDINNQYPIDPEGEETIKWFKIAYRKREAEAVLNDRMIYLKSQRKESNKQSSLF